MRYSILSSLFMVMLFLPSLALGANKTNQTTQRLLQIENVVLSLGTYMEAFRELQADAAGNKNDFEFTPYIGLALETKTKWDFLFYPELFIVLPQKSSLGNVTTTIYVAKADFGKSFLKDKLIATIGSSLIFTNISGSGGTVRLNNGSSSNFSEFYVPDETRNSINNSLDLGLRYKFNKNLAINAGLMILQLFEKERRSFNYLFSLQYFWEGIKK